MNVSKNGYLRIYFGDDCDRIQHSHAWLQR